MSSQFKQQIIKKTLVSHDTSLTKYMRSSYAIGTESPP